MRTNALKTVCPILDRVGRSFIAVVQRGGVISLWTFFWLISGEVSWSPHPQPSDSNYSMSACLWGTYSELLPPGGGFSISAIAQRLCYMYPCIHVSLEGEPEPYPSSVQLLSRVWLFLTPWTAAQKASQSITNCWSLLKLMSIESVTPSNSLILCRPLLLLPSIFPSIRVVSNASGLWQVA